MNGLYSAATAYIAPSTLSGSHFRPYSTNTGSTSGIAPIPEALRTGVMPATAAHATAMGIDAPKLAYKQLNLHHPLYSSAFASLGGDAPYLDYSNDLREKYGKLVAALQLDNLKGTGFLAAYQDWIKSDTDYRVAVTDEASFLKIAFAKAQAVELEYQKAFPPNFIPGSITENDIMYSALASELHQEGKLLQSHVPAHETREHWEREINNWLAEDKKYNDAVRRRRIGDSKAQNHLVRAWKHALSLLNALYSNDNGAVTPTVSH